MRASDFLAAAADLPVSDLDAVAGGGGLVVVAPHPDDESLGCGGLIAEARRRGRAVRVVVLSDGCGSHPGSRRYPAERLRALREAETYAAVSELGLASDDVRFLRLPDGGVPREGAGAAQAVAALAEAARACTASALFVTWGHDPHCDHAAAAAIAARASADMGADMGLRVLAYPVWGWTLPGEAEVGPAPRGFRLAIDHHRAAKARAVAAHASQTTDLIDDDPEGFRLPPAMIERLCGPFEIFLEGAS